MDEIKEMQEKVDVEIEAFIHGAMRISYSVVAYYQTTWCIVMPTVEDVCADLYCWKCLFDMPF